MVDTQMRIFFISAYDTKESERINAANNLSLLEDLKRLGFDPVEVEGRYQGIDEQSFAVKGTFQHEVGLIELAKSYGQQSILSLEATWQAETLFTSGVRFPSGTMVEVDKDTALNDVGYSYINEKYFILK